MPMYNLIECSHKYGKTSGSLWQNCRDKPDDNNIGNSESCKFKSRFPNIIDDSGTIDIEIVVPLKSFSKFWETLEMPLLNFEINLDLTCSPNCTIGEEDRVTTFVIYDTKRYVPTSITIISRKCKATVTVKIKCSKKN